MSLAWVILLAVVQGLTEFLPVSSSAHLAILGALSGLSEEDAFVFFLVLHGGTLLATLLFFWRDLWAFVRGLLGRDAAGLKTLLLVLLSCVPTGILGLSLKGPVERAFSSPALSGLLLFVTAGLLLWSDRFPEGRRSLGDLSWKDALLVGTAQGLAVFPGISRSGATLVMALGRGLRPVEAFRFSFLCSLPAVGGAFLLEGLKAFSASNPYLLDDASGFALAFLVGLMALRLLKGAVEKGHLGRFALWCAAAGIAGLLVGWLR